MKFRVIQIDMPTAFAVQGTQVFHAAHPAEMPKAKGAADRLALELEAAAAESITRMKAEGIF